MYVGENFDTFLEYELYNWYLCCEDGVDVSFKQGSIFEELLIFCGGHDVQCIGETTWYGYLFFFDSDVFQIACPWIGCIGVTINKYLIERVGSDQIFVRDHHWMRFMVVGVLYDVDISDAMVELTIC